MESTIVVFRMDRVGVFALFPELPADRHGTYCTCYQHIGQHCSADYAACIAQSRPATPTEFAELYAELKQRGYHLAIRRRATPATTARRRQLSVV